MNVAIFCTHTTWLSHFETELEIAQLYLDKGFKVDFYICNDTSFECCENILSRSLIDKTDYFDISNINCEFCKKRQKNGFSKLEGEFNVFPLIDSEFKNSNFQIDQTFLESHNKLKKLYHDDIYDIGWGIISSFISFTRDPYLNLFEYKTQIEKLYSDSVRVYESAKRVLMSNKYDQIYIFNSRFSYTRGLFRLGLSLNIPTFVHERGANPNKFELFYNNTPHNINFLKERVNEYWHKGKVFRKKIIGKKFFRMKINGFGGSWKSFTNNFEINKLPNGFDDSKKNIVFFTSSEDEFSAIDDTYFSPFFSSQLDCLSYLCKEFEKLNDSNLKFYIRIHPNSKNMVQSYLDEIHSYSRYKNVEIISPDSSINSYSLLFNAHKIITYGSTMTIEAVFWGKPSLLLSNYELSNFKGPIIPTTFDEIINLCFINKLKKPDRTDAIKLGYYFSTYGRKYKYYKAVDYLNGYFKGVNLSTGEVLHIKESFLRYRINVIKGFLYRTYKKIFRDKIINN